MIERNKLKFIWKGFSIGLIVFAFYFVGFIGVANSVDYTGLIAVRSGVPLTPAPPPPTSLPTNLRFFLNNSNPSPVDTPLGLSQLVPQGDALNAIYNVVDFGTITVLADDGTRYGRTSIARNISSGVDETMDFRGGYKGFELVAFSRLF